MWDWGRYSQPVDKSGRCPSAPPRVTCCASNHSLRASRAPPPRLGGGHSRSARAHRRENSARKVPILQQPDGRPQLTFPSESGPPLAMPLRAVASTSHYASSNASSAANLSIPAARTGQNPQRRVTTVRWLASHPQLTLTSQISCAIGQAATCRSSAILLGTQRCRCRLASLPNPTELRGRWSTIRRRFGTARSPTPWHRSLQISHATSLVRRSAPR